MKKIILILIILASLTTFVAASSCPSNPPTVYTGTITTEDATGANGQTLKATINNKIVGQTVVEGNRYYIDVAPCMGTSGTIKFNINNEQANEQFFYAGNQDNWGKIIGLNLSFGTIPGGSLCGNGIIDSGEECDSNAFGGETCASYLGDNYAGDLSCTASCEFNANSCVYQDIPPNAEAGGPYTCNEGDTIILDGSDSSDNSGLPLTYNWEIFPTQDQILIDNRPDLTGETLEYLCGVGDSLFDVHLTVYDNEGLSDTSDASITISNIIPEVEAGPDQTVDEGVLVTLHPTWIDYAVDVHRATIDWGDDIVEVFEDVTSGIFAPTHVYNDGVYTVNIEVEDEASSGTDFLRITVNNVIPDVNAGDSYYTKINQEICLSSVTPTGEIFTFDWDLDNDETYDILDHNEACWTWPETGTYEVKLRVTDDDGDMGYDTTTVTVYEYGISLHSGWNLISVPLVPEQNSVQQFFLDQLYDHMADDSRFSLMSLQYNSETGKNDWLKSDRDGQGDLYLVTPGYAYWVNVIEDSEVFFNGEKYLLFGLPPEVRLAPSSWNLIGKYGITEVLKMNEIKDLSFTTPELRDLADYPLIRVNDTNQGLSKHLELGENVVPNDGYWTYMGGNSGQSVGYLPSDADYNFDLS